MKKKITCSNKIKYKKFICFSKCIKEIDKYIDKKIEEKKEEIKREVSSSTNQPVPKD